ncbi:MAG: peptidylprolyl isomerase [Stellaceae bacterium]
MRSFLLYPAIAVILALTPALPARAEHGSVARIGKEPVTAAEIQGFIAALNPQQREQAARDPKVSAELVRSAVARKLLLDEATKAGWDKKPAIATEIERAREQIVLTTYLQAQTLPPKDYPSDKAIRAAYDANRGHLFQYRVAQIFLADPSGSSPEKLAEIAKRAAELAKRVKARPSNFTAVAKAESDDKASAARGGDLGWLAQNQIRPEMLGAVAGLGDTGVTEPIRAAGGWHILKVSGVKPAELVQVRGEIINLLRRAKMQQEQQEYIAKLLDREHVSIDDKAAAELFAAEK